MEALDFNLKITGKSGPFAVRALDIEESINMAEAVSKNKMKLAEQYLDIAFKTLCYKKSGKPVYREKAKLKQDIGGGNVIKIAQQAMRYSGLMDEEDLAEQVEEAGKN